jgi:hypothetical protein
MADARRKLTWHLMLVFYAAAWVYVLLLPWIDPR